MEPKRYKRNGYTVVETFAQTAAREAAKAKAQVVERHKKYLGGSRWLLNLETFKEPENA